MTKTFSNNNQKPSGIKDGDTLRQSMYDGNHRHYVQVPGTWKKSVEKCHILCDKRVFEFLGGKRAKN